MDENKSFRVTDVTSRVGTKLGPVLVFQTAQSKPRQILLQTLTRRTVIKTTSAAESTQLWIDLCEIRDLFALGEPLLPRRMVVTMLIVRKFYLNNFWGGGHEKNFLWGDDIANGRGVSPTFKDIAQEIAHFLYQKGIFIVKYEGKKNKGQKYALNPKQRADIATLANDGYAGDNSIERWFFKDNNRLSARDLDNWKPI